MKTSLGDMLTEYEKYKKGYYLLPKVTKLQELANHLNDTAYSRSHTKDSLNKSMFKVSHKAMLTRKERNDMYRSIGYSTQFVVEFRVYVKLIGQYNRSVAMEFDDLKRFFKIPDQKVMKVLYGVKAKA